MAGGGWGSLIGGSFALIAGAALYIIGRVQANAIITKQTDALKQQVKGAEDTAERQLRAYVGVTSGNYVDAFRKPRWTNFRFIVSGDLSAGPAQLHPL